MEKEQEKQEKKGLSREKVIEVAAYVGGAALQVCFFFFF